MEAVGFYGVAVFYERGSPELAIRSTSLYRRPFAFYILPTVVTCAWVSRFLGVQKSVSSRHVSSMNIADGSQSLSVCDQMNSSSLQTLSFASPFIHIHSSTRRASNSSSIFLLI
jgi:hypothetical protein